MSRLSRPCVIAVSVVLAFLLTLSAAGCAYAAEPNTGGLDAAFDSGKPTLKETESARLNPAVSDFDITEGLLALAAENGGLTDPEEISAGLAFVSDSGLILFSRSAAGNSGFANDGHEMFALFDGKCRFIYPAGNQVLKDDDQSVLRSFWMSFMSRLDGLAGEEGIAYSPDGRYAAFPNAPDFMQWTGPVRKDPILFDLSAGKVFQIEGYAEGDIPGVITVAFSPDNRYLYFMAGGWNEEKNCRLYRYDLDTGTTEFCFAVRMESTSPGLAALQDESMVILDSRWAEAQEVLLRAACRDGAWTVTETSLANSAGCRAGALRYAPEAGRICLIRTKSERGEGSAFAFQIIQPDEAFEGVDRFLCISMDTHEIAALSADELQEAFDAAVAEAPNAKGRIIKRFVPYLVPYEFIDKTVFSPDGNYLLVKTGAFGNPERENSRSSRLFLVRLSDLAVQEVQGLDAGKICYSLLSPMRIEWNTDELIISTEDGIRTYIITAGE